MGQRAAIYQAVITLEAACQAMVATVSADFVKVDILVNNAGISSIHGVPLGSRPFGDVQSSDLSKRLLAFLRLQW